MKFLFRPVELVRGGIAFGDLNSSLTIMGRQQRVKVSCSRCAYVARSMYASQHRKEQR